MFRLPPLLGYTTIACGLACSSALASGPKLEEPPAVATEEAAVENTEAAEATEGFASEKAKVSYAIGMNIGTNLRMQEMDVDQTSLIQGLSDAISGSQGQLTEAEMQETLMNFQQEFARKQQEKMLAEGETNKAEGEAFLAENGNREGVITTDSGLQYEVLQEGEGEKPSATDVVECHYEGKLLDGTVFDSSYERGQATTFPLNRVIPGWTEGLQLMSPGSKYRLYIPSELAYGPRGMPPRISPNATLTFDIELISVQKQDPAAAPGGLGLGGGSGPK